MAANYVLLERIELNAAVASVYFGNIPQSGYTDLKIVTSVRDSYSGVASAMQIFFNGSSTSFSQRFLQGSGTTANSGTTPSQFVGNDVSATATSNTFSNVEIYVPNYLSSNYKSYSVDSVTENNATAAYANLVAGLWSNTAAINSITLAPVSGQAFLQYSTFSLYGLAAVGTTPVIAPKASGGNITTDGTYWIHTFNTTGAFVPSQALSCDYLVVAGGGGGGADIGAGGGAGGYRTGSALSLASSTSYTVTVGAGGAGSTSSSVRGSSGIDSILSSITSSGGGGGGSNGLTGNAGGSGGGGSRNTSAGGAGNTPSTSPAQGTNGGAANYATSSGGGGGATSAGSTSSTVVGGNGGNGTASSITGTSITYAGGGGGASYPSSTGSSGGTGGGGAGGYTDGGITFVQPVNGTTNLGGGGGGGRNVSSTNGANGGSGVVIIRYLVA